MTWRSLLVTPLVTLLVTDLTPYYYYIFIYIIYIKRGCVSKNTHTSPCKRTAPHACKAVLSGGYAVTFGAISPFIVDLIEYFAVTVAVTTRNLSGVWLHLADPKAMR